MVCEASMWYNNNLLHRYDEAFGKIGDKNRYMEVKEVIMQFRVCVRMVRKLLSDENAFPPLLRAFF